MRILGIETSFDDTGFAIYDTKKGLIVNKVLNQSNIHNKYGGVIPEIAAREHVYQLNKLSKYIIHNKKIFMKNINAVAYTAGPGLSGSLIVGATFSCALAFSYNIPSIPINHMEGHLLSPMLENKIIKFPFLSLLVSGKHTQLILVNNFRNYKLLGTTLDDAVGEVFDKIAKALKLGYPGGAALSDFANYGKLGKFIFPKPMKYHKNFNFSFSGLKTFTLNLIHKNINNQQNLYDIAFSFEDTILDVLVYKSVQALKKYNLKKILIAGGVSSNYKLLNRFKNVLKTYNYKLFYPKKKFCTDNAAMIAYSGVMHFKYCKYKKNNILINPKWNIEQNIF